MIGTLNEVKAVVKTNEQQKEVIENVAHYRHLFHPSYINNYSLVALTNASSLEEYKFDTGNKMSALNDAFFVMEEYLERCFDRYEEAHSDIGVEESVLLKKMRIVAEDWRNKYKVGSSFIAVENVLFIVAGLKKLGHSVPVDLRRSANANICAGLLSLADAYKSFIKIDVYLGFEVLYDFYERLLEMFYKNPTMMDLVERVEVAKEAFPKTLLYSEAHAKPFPTINIYLKKSYLSPGKREVVALLRGIQDRLADYPAISTDTIYTREHSKNLTIAQGFRNYKKILACCNLLDNVYDARSNYAFLKRPDRNMQSCV